MQYLLDLHKFGITGKPRKRGQFWLKNFRKNVKGIWNKMKMKNGVFVFVTFQYIKTYIFRILSFSWVRICIWFHIYCISFEENRWSITRSEIHLLWSFCLPTEKSRQSRGEIVLIQKNERICIKNNNIFEFRKYWGF